jgi:hypothetical protein
MLKCTRRANKTAGSGESPQALWFHWVIFADGRMAEIGTTWIFVKIAFKTVKSTNFTSGFRKVFGFFVRSGLNVIGSQQSSVYAVVP